MENKDTEVLVSSIVQRRDKFNGKAIEVNSGSGKRMRAYAVGFY